MNFAAIEGSGCFGKFTVAKRRQARQVVRQAWQAAAVVAAMLGVAGCATGPFGGVSKDSPQEVKVAAVTKRAQERWDLLLKGDVKAAYAYLSPASRAVVSPERYQSRVNPANFRAIKLDTVSCEAESCRLRFWLTFDHRLMRGVQTPLEETWIFEDGLAWYVYRE